ncbi:MAG: tripartite tricarboxylate transporter substrate binding protein [Variibacter sp.]|nr:tripartite tricarboxylate transporter substrate binding protein [Variibacter sp.]
MPAGWLITRVLLTIACGMAAVQMPQAQTYPHKPITLIVASSAGGPADVAARLIVDRMSVALGQQIIVETVPGAGGTMGMTRVARAAPDGYTLLIHQNGFAITPAIYDKLPFDAHKDFVAIGLVNQSRTYLVGRKSLPAETFAELLAWMKSPGTTVKIAHPGKGTFGHLQMIALVRALGVRADLIPYRGSALALNDLLGGHVDMGHVAAAVSATYVRAGSVKAFAYTGEKRSDIAHVATYGEVGLPQMARSLWHVLFAPAGTPASIVERLNAALAETLNDARVVKAYADSGVETFPKDQWSVAAAQAMVRGELEFYAKLTREHGIKVDQ